MLLSLVSGIYSLIIGVGIIGLWLMLILTKQVPEIKSEPIAIGFHIVVENIMGILSVLSGIMFLLNITGGSLMFILTSGLVIYAVINSAGYYGQKKQWSFVCMFGAILVTSITLVIFHILDFFIA
ncbi:MAG: hypothetical protein HGN29_11245 [Asgard group archaeon]|nr:hypothetical protein [Asgard group archaeon]